MMHSIRQHLIAEIFVIATGFAALVHSTWSVGTLFSGMQPLPDLSEDGLRYALRYVAWVLPALLIAFALDIGQIATSHEIRQCIQRGEQPFRKYVVFVVFALATYYLQWLYMAYHMPLLTLGTGVSAFWTSDAITLRDIALWVVPAFLPLSTLLYTFSHVQSESSSEAHSAPVSMRSTVRVYDHFELPIHDVHLVPSQSEASVSPHFENALPKSEAEPIALTAIPVSMPPTVERIVRSGASGGERTGATDGNVRTNADGTFTGVCPDCGRGFPSKTHRGAANALSSHMGRFCTIRKQNAMQSVNGNGHQE